MDNRVYSLSAWHVKMDQATAFSQQACRTLSPDSSTSSSSPHTAPTPIQTTPWPSHSCLPPEKCRSSHSHHHRAPSACTIARRTADRRGQHLRRAALRTDHDFKGPTRSHTPEALPIRIPRPAQPARNGGKQIAPVLQLAARPLGVSIGADAVGQAALGLPVQPGAQILALGAGGGRAGAAAADAFGGGRSPAEASADLHVIDT